VRSTTARHRDRMVGITSSTVGAHNSHTVRKGGSSMLFNKASAAESVNRSASSTIRTCQRSPAGDRAACRTSRRTSSTLITFWSVTTRVTSACDPANAVRHARHVPQPRRSHSRAAAKARAALERPDPGGPVTSQACVIPVAVRPCSASAAASTLTRSCAVRTSWPTKSAQTLIGHRLGRAARLVTTTAPPGSARRD